MNTLSQVNTVCEMCINEQHVESDGVRQVGVLKESAMKDR